MSRPSQEGQRLVTGSYIAIEMQLIPITHRITSSKCFQVTTSKTCRKPPVMYQAQLPCSPHLATAPSQLVTLIDEFELLCRL